MTALSTLRDALIDQLGLLAIDQMIPTSSLNRSINIGLQRLSREIEWPHLQAFTTFDTVPGTELYALPANFKSIITLGIQQYRLQYISFGELVTYSNYQNRPSVYLLEGSQILLKPTPTQIETVAMVYDKLEPALVADGDSPLLPSIYDDILIIYAAQHQAIRLKDLQLINALEQARRPLMASVELDFIQSQQTQRINMRKDSNPRVF